MSWVFLGDARVYKLKKPLRQGALDYRGLNTRAHNCREEIRLNRRLAPEVYLGSMPLTLEASGALALGGAGRIVDWLVVMRRLPEDRMLDAMIGRKSVQPRDIARIVALLSGFYHQTPQTPMDGDDYLQILRQRLAEDRAVVGDARFGLAPQEFKPAFGALEGVLLQEPELLLERVRRGRIVEGHGDLRPEHLCLLEPPVVIDCLEFDPRLRCVDPFEELAYLALECELLGAAWIGPLLIDGCAERLDDHPPARLIDFHTAARACLRARLALSHLLEPRLRQEEKWLPLARRHLAVARDRAVRLQVPEAPQSSGSRDT